MNLLERWNALISQMRTRWGALPPPQRRVVLLSALAFAVLGGVSLWWGTRPDWRTLFRDLDGRDAAQVEQQLAAASIPFEVSPDGAAIEVTAENLDKARVAIAAKGMPQSGRLGFELFDKPNWSGSEFDEKVNYQRALEGELEHTIGTMDAVRSARVHLVLPVHGAFSSEDQPAKASVVLTLRHGLDARAQGAAMRALVAGAVEGLMPGAVTLVDADAKVDFTALDSSSASKEEEQALQQKLVALLEPLAGAGNVRATVNVSYHTGSEERTEEVYDPNGSVPVATERTEQTSQAVKAGGVAGTASNTPALTPATAPTVATTGAASAQAAGAPAPTAAAPAGQSQVSRQESNSYAVTRHTAHSEEGPGRVRRLTAAVVINDRAVTEGSGARAHTLWKPRTADEMKRLQQIAQAAVGFESSRGDEIVVQNVAFQANGDGAPASGAAAMLAQGKDLLRSQPSLLRTLGVGMSLVVLGLLVLRPLGKQAVSALALPAAPLIEAPKTAQARIQDAQMLIGHDLPTPDESVLRRNETLASSQRLLEEVSARIVAEPRGSARLVGSWIRSGSEMES